MTEVCLYRSWTWDVNGQPSKAHACYPGSGGCAGRLEPNALGVLQMIPYTEADIGKTVTEPFRSVDGKAHKMQVIRCKYPECI